MATGCTQHLDRGMYGSRDRLLCNEREKECKVWQNVVFWDMTACSLSERESCTDVTACSLSERESRTDVSEESSQ